MLGIRPACAAAALFLVSALSPVAAQDSGTPQSSDRYDWRKLPQKTAEGIAGTAPCGWLVVETRGTHLTFHGGRQYEIRAPNGKHFVNFTQCMNYTGFRVRVTYTKAPEDGYDGEFHVVQVLAAVSLAREKMSLGLPMALKQQESTWWANYLRSGSHRKNPGPAQTAL